MKQFAAILLSLVATPIFGAQFPCDFKAPPERQQDQLVWQFGEAWLSKQDALRLNTKLVEFARETSNQIFVLVVDTLCGLPESDLAFQVGEAWGIGQKRFDNGVVILIKPFGAPGQRVSYIAVGYGLEAVIPDLAAKRIVDREMIPEFQAGNAFRGLDKATDVLMALAKGEFDEKSYGKKPPAWPVLIFFLGFIAVMIFAWQSSVKRYAAVNKLDFWTAMWLMSQMQQRHGPRGGFGGGGFGGGGGGGFGGFGGGGFGGGGAGGRW
jgi:uncharacterized protein